MILAAVCSAGCASSPGIPRLVKDLHHPDPLRRTRAVEKLGTLDPRPEVLPEIALLLKDKDTGVYRAAASVLPRWGTAAGTAVAPYLADPEAWLRCRAAETLKDMGPAAAPAVPALAKALEDHDACVSGRAVEALGRVGDPAVQALLTALRDPNPEVRRAAAGAVAALPSGVQAKAAEVLVPALESRDEFERGEAFQRLAAMGPPAASVLRRYLRNKDGDIRLTALQSLGECGDVSPDTLRALAGLFPDADRLVRLKATEVTGSLGSRHPETVLPFLTAFAASADRESRRGAIRALGAMGTEAAAAVPLLVSYLGGSDADIREESHEALMRIGTSESLAAAERYARGLRNRALGDSRTRPDIIGETQ
jgi:HEAT repeat protein